MKLKVVILADEDLRRHTNCGYISTQDMAAHMRMVQADKAEVIISPSRRLYFGCVNEDAERESGQLALSKEQCSFANLKAGEEVELTLSSQKLKSYDKLEIEIELESPTANLERQIPASQLAVQFKSTLHRQAVSAGQYMTIRHKDILWLCTIVHGHFGEMKGKEFVRDMVEKSNIKKWVLGDFGEMLEKEFIRSGFGKSNIGKSNIKRWDVKPGIVNRSTRIVIEIPEGQPISGCEEAKTVLKEKLDEAGVDAKLISMGIAGMTSQILEKVRPAFFSRMMTPGRAMRKQPKHVKGILLHGPPGTGKTLIAKHICDFFNTKDPVVVSGPAFLSPYFSQSQKEIFKLFEPAFDDWEKYGYKSDLHVIIIDEIDSMTKKRTGNMLHLEDEKNLGQFLTLIDGVNTLHNVLIIGTTNQRGQIDEAFLRSGRIEFQIPIDFPNEQQRAQILDWTIHQLDVPHDDTVDVLELARMTDGCSGADLVSIIHDARNAAGAKPALLGLVPSHEIVMTMSQFVKVARAKLAMLREFKDGTARMQQSEVSMGDIPVGVLNLIQREMEEMKLEISKLKAAMGARE